MGIGFALYLAVMAAGIFVFAPAYRRGARAAGAGPSSPEYRRAVRAPRVGGPIVAAAIVAIAVLMVVKPG